MAKMGTRWWNMMMSNQVRLVIVFDQSNMLLTDQVMMTPLKKEMDSTILRVERLPPTEATEGGGGDGDRHVAGGQHQGIIINKQLASLDSARGPCDLRLSFKVFLVNAITQIHQQELRELRFWFDNSVASAKALSPSKLTNGNSSDTYMARMQCAQAFFRALVNATDFPKSYVAFITKLMKIMQNRVYRPLVQIELEVRLLDEPFNRPSSSNNSRKYSSRQYSIDPCSACRQNLSTQRATSDVRPQPAPRNKVPPPIAPKPQHLRGSNYSSMSMDGERSLAFFCSLQLYLCVLF